MKTLGILLTAALLAAPCVAQTAGTPDDDTDWTVEVPPKPPEGGGSPVTEPTTPEGGFSRSERIVFSEDMRNHVLDQLCRNAQIPLGHSFALSDFGAVGASGVRRLRVMPDNRVAIEDSQRVSLDLGRTLLTETVSGGAASFGLWIGGHFDGSSVVIRPMPTTKSCDEVWRLLKVTDAKSIVPFKAERLAEMGVGELWKLPAVLTIGHTETVSRAFGDAAGLSGAPVISFGIGQNGSAMMTVYRMSEDKMRFRFRISHARVHGQSGAIAAVYPALHVFAAPANVLAKVVDGALANLISHYLQENIGIFFSQSDGQQLLMEFILDPKNPQDMDELAAVLRGDFATLLKMAQRMVNLQATALRAQSDFRGLEAEQVEAFHRPANFPGMDINHTNAKSLHLMLPFLFDHTRASSLADDRIVRLDQEGGEVHIFRSDKAINTGVLDVPIKGQLVKHNAQESVQAFVFKDKDGKTSAPQAVYIAQDGFLRRSSNDVRRAAQDVNDILRLAGAKGGETNPRTTLPLDRILPPEPPIKTGQAPGQTSERYPTYHDGAMSFTLVLNEKAVAAIAAASAELLVRSYANTVTDRSDRQVLGWLADSGAFAKPASPAFDGAAIKDRFHYDDNDVNWVRGLAQTAARLVSDLSAVRNAPNPEARAEALVQVMSGRGDSGLAYGEIMKVLVQLVDPRDVTADLVMNVTKEIKGDPDLHAHMVLKKDRPENPGLKQAGEAKNRFAQPSELVD